MNLLQFLKEKINNKNGKKYAVTPTLTYPIFTQYGQIEYDSVVVQQAINCIVREMKKLVPQHVQKIDHEFIPQHDSIQRILDNPNPIMTTSDFVERVVWNLLFNYNSFVLPTWDENNNLTALYPIQPNQVDFLQDRAGEYWVTFHFNNLIEGTVRYRDVIHIRYNYALNDFMGGNELGQPNNAVLDKTLELNDIMLDGVGRALKSSFAVNGIIKFNTIIDENKAAESIARLEQKLRNNESGLMGLDLKSEYTPLTRDIKMVDADTLKFLDEKVLRHFGVPIDILTGDYTTEQYEAFYQKTLEPIIISMGQAFSKCIFTDHERFGFGHRIIFQPKELIFLSTQQKLESLRLLGDAGALYVNEARALIGLPTLKEFDGVKFMSLNYVQNDDDMNGNNGNTDKEGDGKTSSTTVAKTKVTVKKEGTENEA